MIQALFVIGGAAAFWFAFVVIVGMPMNTVAQGMLVVAGAFVGRSLWKPYPSRMLKGIVAGAVFSVGLLLMNSFDPTGGSDVLGTLLRMDLSVGSRSSQIVIDYTWGFFAGVLVDIVGND